MSRPANSATPDEMCCSGCSCGASRPLSTGVSRRDFVAKSTLAAIGAMLAAACGDGIIGPSGKASSAVAAGTWTYKLSDYPALAAVGGIARADAGSTPIALVRASASTVAAYSLVCPHQGTTVNISGSGFKCPNHGATFSASGTWIGGQQTGNLTPLVAQLDIVAGIITVGGVTSPQTPQQPSQPGGTGNVNLVVMLSGFPALAAVGGVARVDGGAGVPIGAARTATSTFVAYTLSCTHQGTTVNLNGGGWLCPNHGATFDATGKVTGGPATTNLAALNVAYDPAAGTLTITGNAPTTTGGGSDGDGEHDP